MKKISEDEVKKIQLQLLLQFHEICEERNWKYSIVAGTMIGAVRHKGFIPWDDDIDIMMPRPDYNAMLRLFTEEDVGMGIVSCYSDNAYGDVIAKIYNRETFLKDCSVDVESSGIGVFIDIFAVDGVGNDIKSACHCARKGMALQLLMTCAGMKIYSKSATHSVIYEPIRYICFLITRSLNANYLARILDRKCQRVPYARSKYVAVVCGSYRDKTVMDKEDFEDLIDIEFEGHWVKVIRKYDMFLRKCYGNYLQLPPKEKQKSCHSFDAFYR